MIGDLKFEAEQADRSLLYVAELLHRVHNEYTKTIAFASTVALRSADLETKGALSQIIEHLYASAKVYRILSPPAAGQLVDFTANLTKMCRMMACSGLNERAIELHLSISDSIVLDSLRAWRANLVLSELITNASRHAFGAKGGKISTAVTIVRGHVVCQVSDDGKSASAPRAGLGTQIVDALADDLEGGVERCFSENGTTITLRFPKGNRPRASSVEGAIV